MERYLRAEIDLVEGMSSRKNIDIAGHGNVRQPTMMSKSQMSFEGGFEALV